MPSAPAPIHEEGLRHQLSAGQMAMVAVGGSIGTGLLLGSGAAMEIAGPAAILSFIAAAFINWTVAMALGELACAHPAAGSFGVYGDLYLNPFAGFIARAGYWIGLALAIGAEMVAAATYMATWFPGVRPYLWIVVFAALLLAINLRSVGSYGRVEFWLSMIKLATIIAFIVIGAALLTSGRVTPQYNAQGGFFPKGLWSPLIAMTFAIYSFGGVEMVAVTTGESRSSKETPRAVWLDLSHSHLRLCRRHRRPSRRHALEPRRRHREPLRHHLPHRQNSPRLRRDELRRPHRRALRRQRHPLRRLPHALLSRPHRMGPSPSRPPQS